jgi:hypothetical protein
MSQISDFEKLEQSWLWCRVPATWEAEVGGSLETSLGNTVRPCLPPRPQTPRKLEQEEKIKSKVSQ